MENQSKMVVFLSDTAITEFSAGAVGIAINACQCIDGCETFVIRDNPSRDWEPLIYDDQAFFLLSALKINVEFNNNAVKVCHTDADDCFIVEFTRQTSENALRRAIVRMAAYIYLARQNKQ